MIHKADLRDRANHSLSVPIQNLHIMISSQRDTEK